MNGCKAQQALKVGSGCIMQATASAYCSCWLICFWQRGWQRKKQFTGIAWNMGSGYSRKLDSREFTNRHPVMKHKEGTATVKIDDRMPFAFASEFCSGKRDRERKGTAAIGSTCSAHHSRINHVREKVTVRRRQPVQTEPVVPLPALPSRPHPCREERERSLSARFRASGASMPTCQRLVTAAKRKEERTALLPLARRRRLPQDDGHQKPGPLKRRAFRRLEEKGHPRVSARTVGRALSAAGFIRQYPARKPLLTERHKRLRLEWCLQHQLWTEEDWGRVVFSDESSLVFRPYRQKLLVLVGGTPLPAEQIVKFPPKLMIWGGISMRGATPVASIAGTVDSDAYQRILSGYLLPTMGTLYPEGFILQQDNAPCHVSRSSKKFYEEHGIEVLPWPPQSPDLNPIENLWGIIKKDFAPQARTTVAEWKECGRGSHSSATSRSFSRCPAEFRPASRPPAVTQNINLCNLLHNFVCKEKSFKSRLKKGC